MAFWTSKEMAKKRTTQTNKHKSKNKSKNVQTNKCRAGHFSGPEVFRTNLSEAVTHVPGLRKYIPGPQHYLPGAGKSVPGPRTYVCLFWSLEKCSGATLISSSPILIPETLLFKRTLNSSNDPIFVLALGSGVSVKESLPLPPTISLCNRRSATHARSPGPTILPKYRGDASLGALPPPLTHSRWPSM